VILVDTPVWIDHLNHGDPNLTDLLNSASVSVHPFVIGELACGNLRNRGEILSLLRNLPEVTRASDGETLAFIETRNLMGRGLGYIDIHLLASVALTPESYLWTRDKRLAESARMLQLGYQPPH
jgi:predicted nucleic acid-binding protein